MATTRVQHILISRELRRLMQAGGLAIFLAAIGIGCTPTSNNPTISSSSSRNELALSKQIRERVEKGQYSEAAALFDALHASHSSGVGYHAYPRAAFAFDQIAREQDALHVLDLLSEELARGHGYLAPHHAPRRFLRDDFDKLIPSVKSSAVKARMEQINSELDPPTWTQLGRRAPTGSMSGARPSQSETPDAVTPPGGNEITQTVGSSGRVVSAYQSAGDKPLKIAMYQKMGTDFNLVGLVEAKGRINFDSNGIVGDADAFVRLQIDGQWQPIIRRKVIDGHAMIATADGKNYSIFNLGIGPLAGEIELIAEPATTTTVPTATQPSSPNNEFPTVHEK